jgi:hypothetical protein
MFRVALLGLVSFFQHCTLRINPYSLLRAGFIDLVDQDFRFDWDTWSD